MRGVGITVLVLAAVASCIAVPLPKCKIGTGLTNPKDNPYGTAKPGECMPCMVKHCNYCTDNYKKCEGCGAGYGFDSSKKTCKACKDSNCGVCDKTYTKCIAKKADCSKSIVYPANWTAVAKKVSASGKTFCPGPAGFQGTGYTSTFTTTVKNGVALDGNGPDFRPYTDGKLNFCTFQSRAQSVATGAFQGVSGCSMPSDVTYTLQKACITQKSDLPFYLTFVFNATCGGQTKNIAVMGGGYYKPKPGVDPESKWTYAIIS